MAYAAAPKPPEITPVSTRRKWVWLEEYAHCGCSNVTETKREAIGYCPKHGCDRLRITMIPNDGIELGLATVG